MSETPHFGPVDACALSARERADRYRALAAWHLDLGHAAQAAEARAGHLELAALWMRLAAQAEHQLAEDRALAGGVETDMGARPSA